MKKIETQKGITLIALIITIVVLLILAVVAIGAVQDSNIIAHAQNAASNYNIAKGNENDAISDMESLLDKYASGGNTGGSNVENPEGPQEPDEPVVDTTLSVGRTIYYNSNPTEDNIKEEWIVYSITDENNFEIISANSMGSLTLGYNDSYLPPSVGDLNGNGTAEDNIDKEIYSYNHAIETINTYCDDIVTATDNSGVRSIGAKTSQDTAGLGHWNVIKGSDTYGETAITYLSSLGGNNCLSSKDSNNYWIASRIRKNNSAYADVFCVYQVGYSGDMNLNMDDTNLVPIIYIGLGSTPTEAVNWIGHSNSAGVRPIITNPVNYSFTND